MIFNGTINLEGAQKFSGVQFFIPWYSNRKFRVRAKWMIPNNIETCFRLGMNYTFALCFTANLWENYFFFQVWRKTYFSIQANYENCPRLKSFWYSCLDKLLANHNIKEADDQNIKFYLSSVMAYGKY